MIPTNSKIKRQNFSEESSMVDIISYMPDSVLSHILSFLPTTKEAVATSTLSKRWRYVWTCVDKLVFHKFGYVSNVLKLHRGNIKEFALRCCGDLEYSIFDVTSWIDTAVARGVQTLDVSINFGIMLPLSVFTCETLVELKLNRSSMLMTIPSALIFPCVKKLQVSVSRNSFESFKRMVSQCSALQHLIIDGYHDSLDIVSSSMKRLELLPLKYVCLNNKILLAVPSLEYLKITINYGLPPEFIARKELSSLIEADIYFLESYCSRGVKAKQLRDSFVRFIQPLSNVKVLRLHCNFQKFLNSVGHGLFLNLTKLEIVSNFFEWRLLVSLMESSINLEAITMKKTSTLKKHKLAWIEPKEVPTCLSLSLKKISIGCNFGCSEDELPMVKYVLRTAQILERVDILCGNDMLQNIRKFRRAAERCEISLLKDLQFVHNTIQPS